MRYPSKLLLVFLTLGLLPARGATGAPLPSPDSYDRGSLEIDVGFFYDDLAPYGDWVEYAD